MLEGLRVERGAFQTDDETVPREDADSGVPAGFSDFADMDVTDG